MGDRSRFWKYFPIVAWGGTFLNLVAFGVLTYYNKCELSEREMAVKGTEVRVHQSYLEKQESIREEYWKLKENVTSDYQTNAEKLKALISKASTTVAEAKKANEELIRIRKRRELELRRLDRAFGSYHAANLTDLIQNSTDDVNIPAEIVNTHFTSIDYELFPYCNARNFLDVANSIALSYVREDAKCRQSVEATYKLYHSLIELAERPDLYGKVRMEAGYRRSEDQAVNPVDPNEDPFLNRESHCWMGIKENNKWIQYEAHIGALRASTSITLTEAVFLEENLRKVKSTLNGGYRILPDFVTLPGSDIVLYVGGKNPHIISQN